MEEAAGRPRAVKKKKSGLRCCGCKVTLARSMWLIMTLMILAGFAYHISLQIIKYLSYPVRLTTIQTLNYGSFPDVTVCPTSFFMGTRSEIISVFPKPHNFTKIIDSIFSKNLALLWNLVLFNQTEVVEIRYKYDYVDPSKFSLMPWYVNSSLAPTLGDNMLECEYAGEFCDFSRFRSFFHPRYGVCYTFSPANETVTDSKLSSGLRMSVSLRDRHYIDVNSAMRDLVPGSAFFVHRRNSFPDIDYPLQKVSKGDMLMADFIYSLNNRLYTPRVACEDEQEYELCRVEPSIGRSCRIYKETPFTRQFINFQNQLKDECECVSEEWPIPGSLKNQTSCHYMPLQAFYHKGFTVHSNQTITLLNLNGQDLKLQDIIDIAAVRKKYNCYKRIYEMAIKTSIEKRTCAIEKHDMKIFYGPHWTQLNNRYMPFVATQARLGQYIIDALKENNKQYKQLNISSIFFTKVKDYDTNTMMDYLLAGGRDSRYIYRAYGTDAARFYVYSSHAKSYVNKEIYLYDAMFFLADAGGVLGLWVGFSLLSILDLIEMAIMRWRRKKAQKKLEESNQNESS